MFCGHDPQGCHGICFQRILKLMWWYFCFCFVSRSYFLVSRIHYIEVVWVTRVLVKFSATKEKTSGGILLPLTTRSKPQRDEVVVVGEHRTVENTRCVKVILAPFRALMLYMCLYGGGGKERTCGV
ncbi:putative GroES-like superfamily, groES chaperonin family, groES chaperonin superfamily [Helianthus anomalus]